MRESGELVQWNDERGFGFIVADNGQRCFVHIKSIGRIATRPRIGDRVSFTVARGSDGRPAAKDVRIVGANPVDPSARRRGASPVRRTSVSWFPAAGAALLVLLALAVGLLERALLWVPVAYLTLGIVSIAAYWFDKRRAEADGWRVSERALHSIDLLGGIAGGLIAQQMLRHKTSKRSFALVTAAIALLHIAVLSGLLILASFG